MVNRSDLTKWAIRLSVPVLLSIACILFPTAGVAAPANDNFADAIALSSPPFTATGDTSGASAEADEPINCVFPDQTVWFSFVAAANQTLAISGSIGAEPANINVYVQNGLGLSGLSFVVCSGFSGPSVFRVESGKTYYLQAQPLFGTPGSLSLNVTVVLPPANDAIAAALSLPGVPATVPADLTAATLEAGEPSPSCGAGPLLLGTAWYTFSPPQTGAYLLTVSSNNYIPQITIYTSSGPGSFSEVACHLGNPTIFHADQGTVYYLQVGNAGNTSAQIGSSTMSIEEAPALVASFFLNPSDPSVFDSTQFISNSFDPAGAFIDTWTWTFGDGATANGCCPVHRYSSDGSYTARLTVTTPDGRSASTEQVITVTTHDVAIEKLTVPQTARAGQTRSLTVGVTNRRYPDTVQVDLYKSLPVGFQLVGSVTHAVAVQQGNRTTAFDFSYQFTNDDATVGKVTFKAVATITSGGRDSLPADNEGTSLPTTVNR